MNGRELFDKAIGLLGYNDEFSNGNSAINRRCEPIVGAIYSDICAVCKIDSEPIVDMSQQIQLDSKIICDCMVYGVAMMIAQGENDRDNQRFFANLYEYKRCKYSKGSDTYEIKDVLP